MGEFEDKLRRIIRNHEDEVYGLKEDLRNGEQRCMFAENESKILATNLQQANETILSLEQELANIDHEIQEKLQRKQDELDLISARATQVTVLTTKNERLHKKLENVQMNYELLDYK